jgi:hypothetical protein
MGDITNYLTAEGGAAAPNFLVLLISFAIHVDPGLCSSFLSHYFCDNGAKN